MNPTAAVGIHPPKANTMDILLPLEADAKKKTVRGRPRSRGPKRSDLLTVK
jgi:hypothetical protein